MLTAQNLMKSFGKRPVIRGIALSLRRGEIVGLLGPNGAGKTTTFRMLTGTVIPDAGRIMLDDTDVTDLPFHERVRCGISYLPQEAFVPRSLSVEDTIMMVLEVRHRSRALRRQILNRLLDELHIGTARKALVGTLSGGQRRRCEIAIMLACEPRYALLDESFAGVDPNTIEDIAILVQQLRGRGIGVLMTDHNTRALLALVDRAYVIEGGRVLAQGSRQEVATNPLVRKIYLGEAFQL